MFKANLNTSHVNLQLAKFQIMHSTAFHLNTSHVNLQLAVLSGGKVLVYGFKYISC